MNYTIELTPKADQDLIEIEVYLSQFYDGTISRFYKLLVEKVDQLAYSPFMYPTYENNPKYLKMVVRDYLVFYIVNDDAKTVAIHRILHGTVNITQHI